jgi:hypothetical protein
VLRLELLCRLTAEVRFRAPPASGFTGQEAELAQVAGLLNPAGGAGALVVSVVAGLPARERRWISLVHRPIVGDGEAEFLEFGESSPRRRWLPNQGPWSAS